VQQKKRILEKKDNLEHKELSFDNSSTRTEEDKIRKRRRITQEKKTGKRGGRNDEG
jgi:hypothetical protein